MQRIGFSERPRGSPLQGVLLGLLVAAEGHAMNGYRLATLAERRLGPAWGLTRSSVYAALTRLWQDELAAVVDEPGGDGPSPVKRLFAATEHTEQALSEWMASPLLPDPVRPELHARIAVARLCDAPMLLRALDACEQRCLGQMLDADTSFVPVGSWAGLTLNLIREASDQSLRAELEWIRKARQWIEDFLADRGSTV